MKLLRNEGLNIRVCAAFKFLPCFSGQGFLLCCIVNTALEKFNSLCLLCNLRQFDGYQRNGGIAAVTETSPLPHRNTHSHKDNTDVFLFPGAVFSQATSPFLIFMILLF